LDLHWKNGIHVFGIIKDIGLYGKKEYNNE